MSCLVWCLVLLYISAYRWMSFCFTPFKNSVSSWNLNRDHDQHMAPSKILKLLYTTLMGFHFFIWNDFILGKIIFFIHFSFYIYIYMVWGICTEIFNNNGNVRRVFYKTLCLWWRWSFLGVKYTDLIYTSIKTFN